MGQTKTTMTRTTRGQTKTTMTRMTRGPDLDDDKDDAWPRPRRR